MRAKILIPVLVSTLTCVACGKVDTGDGTPYVEQATPAATNQSTSSASATDTTLSASSNQTETVDQSAGAEQDTFGPQIGSLPTEFLGLWGVDKNIDGNWVKYYINITDAGVRTTYIDDPQASQNCLQGQDAVQIIAQEDGLYTLRDMTDGIDTLDVSITFDDPYLNFQTYNGSAWEGVGYPRPTGITFDDLQICNDRL